MGSKLRLETIVIRRMVYFDQFLHAHCVKCSFPPHMTSISIIHLSHRPEYEKYDDMGEINCIYIIGFKVHQCAIATWKRQRPKFMHISWNRSAIDYLLITAAGTNWHSSSSCVQNYKVMGGGVLCFVNFYCLFNAIGCMTHRLWLRVLLFRRKRVHLRLRLFILLCSNFW